MQLSRQEAVIYVPGVGTVTTNGTVATADDIPVCGSACAAGTKAGWERLRSTTHLGIGAHPDDVEFMMWQGILRCYQQPEHHFASVVITNGQGSSRTGPYATYSDEQMVAVRLEEQRRVAEAGGYSGAFALGYSSADLRLKARAEVVADLKQIIVALRPQVIYTHNLADRHDSHVAAVLRVLQALRELGPDYHPQEFYGCEVWRSLDWLTGADRHVCDVSERPNLMRALMGLYDSQIAGGKRYDEANFGRRQSNATYNDAYHPDASPLLELAMDLMPLLRDPLLTPEDYFEQLNENFRSDVTARLNTMAGSKEV